VDQHTILRRNYYQFIFKNSEKLVDLGVLKNVQELIQNEEFELYEVVGQAKALEDRLDDLFSAIVIAEERSAELVPRINCNLHYFMIEGKLEAFN